MAQPIKLSKLSLAIGMLIGNICPLTIASSYATEDTNESTSETIVVYGEKFEKGLQDTVTAVSVIGEDELESAEIQTVDKLATKIPNVTEAGFGTISIRGIEGTGASSGGYSIYNGARARISTIVDGNSQSWFGFNYMPTNLWDVQQVEVYRGPQSTSQGTNSIGGALVVVTKDPTFYQEGAIRAGVENYENGNLKYNLAFMSSGALIEDELAYRLTLDGETGDGYINYAQDTTELDDSPDLSYSDNINARLKLLWQPQAIPKLNAKLTLVNQEYDGEYANYVNDSESGYSTQTFTLSNADRTYVRLQDSYVRSVATDIDYEFSDTINNALNLSYSKSSMTFNQYATALDVSSEIDVVSLENRTIYQSPNSAFSGVVGLYLSQSETDTQVSTYYTRDAQTTTAAIYGEGNYSVNSDLKLVAGARIERENNESTLSYSTSGSDETSNIFLPKIGLIYNFNDQNYLTTSLRKGYNAGGFAYNWSSYEYYYYGDESVITFDVALNNKFENGEIVTTLFLNDYDDYQALDSDGYFRNIDESRSYGLEIESTVWVTDSLELNGSLGLLKTEVISDDTAYEGNELPNAANTNASVGFTEYVSDNLSFGGDVVYVGEYYSDLENSDDLKAGDYVTADARVNYLIGDFSINAYVKNITNEDIVTHIRSDGWATIGQTRTFGLDATYSW